MANPAAKVDMTAAALSRLPGMFVDKPRIAALITSIMAPLQTCRDTIYAILSERALANATGAQLDLLGKLVLLPRSGLSDDDYRQRIGVKILVDKSKGTNPDILRISRTFLGAGGKIENDNQGIATYVVRILDRAIDAGTQNDLTAFLDEASSVGVRAIVEASPTDPPSNLLVWDSSTSGIWDTDVYGLDASDDAHPIV